MEQHHNTKKYKHTTENMSKVDIMESRLMYKYVLLMILIANIHSYVFALSIGSSFKNQDVVMNPGDVRAFKASMFTLDDSPVEIDFRVLTDVYYSSYGRDIEIHVVDKEYNILDKLIMTYQRTTTPTSEYEWVLQPDGKTYIHSYPFYIYVKIPDKPTFARDEYKVVISAKTRPEQVLSSLAQSISQERQFVVNVKINGLLDKYKASSQQYDEIIQTNNTEKGNELNQRGTEQYVKSESGRGHDSRNVQNTGMNTESGEYAPDPEDNYIYPDYGHSDEGQKENFEDNNGNNNRITAYSIKDVKEHPYAWSTIVILLAGSIILTILWFR